MKKFFAAIAFVMMTVSSGFAQNISDISTAITLSPFVSATKLLEFSAVGTLAAVQSTRSLVQSRGVAGKEQLKDELVAFNEALMAGQVKTVTDIREAGLRELFEEILADEKQVEEITATVTEGPLLYRVATVVTAALMME